MSNLPQLNINLATGVGKTQLLYAHLIFAINAAFDSYRRDPRRNLINDLRTQAETAVRGWTIRGREPKCDIATSASPTEASMPTPQSDRPPTWTKYELEAVKPLRQCEELTSLDRDTLVRVYPQYLVRLSPKRLGMKFRNVLRIINGDAAA
jgi:hypothetical protein